MTTTERSPDRFTDDDVAAGLDAITGAGWDSDMRAILAAVAPAIAARALREAAAALDQSEWYTVDQAVEFLRGYAGVES